MARTGQTMPAGSYCTMRVNKKTRERLERMVARRLAEGMRASLGGMMDELVAKAAASEEAREA